MTYFQLMLIIFGFGISFRWGYVVGCDKWRDNYDTCMRAKTKAINKD